ncbi:MAG: formylglycine-generating enzyme family protein [Pseudomonadota bacterium]
MSRTIWSPLPLLLLACCLAGGCGEDREDSASPTAVALLPVEAGPFWMGCNPDLSPEDCWRYEDPWHEVEVPAFLMDEVEVSVARYRGCVEDGACNAPPDESRCNYHRQDAEALPVSCATWEMAEAFCAWDGKRLCTEAEWEKAARGTDGRLYPWGDDAPTCERAHFREYGNGCDQGLAAPVGSYPLGASPYGVLDMAGNVNEWVADWWHEDYDGAPTDGSAWREGPDDPYRVFRGGSWLDEARYLRTSFRTGYPTWYGGTFGECGIRCCREDR